MANSMTKRAFLGMSHSPLYGLNPISTEVEEALKAALDVTRKQVQSFDPELVILIGPDLYNGFFNELMPPFCIGAQAVSVGDYLTPAGPLNVVKNQALDLSRHLMDKDFDVAVSYQMEVDHGFSQALQFMWGDLDTPPVIPLFMNAVAEPTVPRIRRCRQLGLAIGEWIDTLGLRTLVIGSGGLSHEPPVPTLKHPDPAVRERITVKNKPDAEQIQLKTQRVMAAGMALANKEPSMKPLAPQWDLRWMDAIEAADLASLEKLTEVSITQDAGMSAHESKTWVIARAAARGASITGVRHYQEIPELIAGYGILFIHN